MTPKEKAQELVSKFTTINLSQVNELVDGIRIRLAKESALIAVDEMLNLGAMVGSDLSDKFYIYWKEVKREIENFNIEEK
jgi:hypothetical protein